MFYTKLRRIGRMVRALDSHPGDREFESTLGLHPRVGVKFGMGLHPQAETRG